MMPSTNHKPDDENQSEESRPLILFLRRALIRLCANVPLLLNILFGACTLLLLLDLTFFFGWADKEAHFDWENGIGFYGAYGFVAYVLLVVLTQYVLRPLVTRGEDFYD